MLETLRTARGVMRSLGIYYGWHQRRRSRAMDALYGRFVKRGDLVFDIGAHVGDRVAAFRRLGAKVVAVEPQPAPRLHARPCSTAATATSSSSASRSAARPATCG